MTSRRELPYAWLIAGLSLVTLLAFLISLSVGPAPVGLGTLLTVGGTPAEATAAIIFYEIRLPRAILGLAIGAALGLSGAALQGLLRNPLAEPGIVGISGCAALGAVAVFYSGLAITWPLALPFGGLVGAFVAVLLLYGLAGREASVTTLILAGIALSALAGALTALALSLSPNPFALAEIVFWLLGSLADRSMVHVALAVPFVVVGGALLLTSGRGLDGLSLGEEAAQSLGISTARLGLIVVVGTALAVGASVAVSGAIGFVGLVVPHLIRPLVGYRPGKLLVPSALGGAALLLLADSLVRVIGTGQELKLGVVTALIGAPFFLALIVSYRRRVV
ncbi:MAG: iron ABC transporter permease [Pseudomonadota bacterium]